MNTLWPDVRPVWTCFIPGEPVARAEKIVKIGTFYRLGDKAPQKSYKAYFKAFIAQKAPQKLLDCPLFLRIEAYKQKPKSARKKDIYPVTKPDISNYVKLVEDCLKGIVIRDDSLVVAQDNRKYFATDTQPPGIRLTLAVDLESFKALGLEESPAVNQATFPLEIKA